MGNFQDMEDEVDTVDMVTGLMEDTAGESK